MEPAEHGHGHELRNHLGPHVSIVRASTPTLSDSESGAAEEHRGGRERSRSPSHVRRSVHAPSPLTVLIPYSSSTAGRSPSRSHAPHHAHTLSQSYSVSTSHVRTHSQEPPLVSTPHTSRPSSPLMRYERLVSGLESEAGEAPPSYESVESLMETRR